MDLGISTQLAHHLLFTAISIGLCVILPQVLNYELQHVIAFLDLNFSEFRVATYLVACVASVVLALVITPVVKKIAIKLEFVDRPGGRKIQANPVSLGGGIAVFLATLFAIVIAFIFSDLTAKSTFFGDDARMLIGLLVGSAATLALGLYDDAKNMRGRYKLLGQLAIASFLVYLGFQIERFSIFGWNIELADYRLVIPFSIFWLVGATNAINLLDGIDGLASSLGMVLCLTFASINGFGGHYPETIVMLALAGALFGFLKFNFAPASIYLGDAGSMVIGLIIGSIAVMTHNKSTAFVAMAIPMAVWSIPILDSTAAILRRYLTGRSIFAPDRGHMHHSLLTRGWSVRQATTFISLVCATTCISAVLGFMWKSEWIVLVTVIAVIAFLISTKTFGHIEFALLRERFRQHGLAFRSDETSHTMPKHGTVRLQGNHEWERLWDALVDNTTDLDLTRLQMTIHIPAVHEAFYANWKAPKDPQLDPDSVWKLSHPILLGDDIVGKLEFAGTATYTESSSVDHIQQVLNTVAPIEEEISRIGKALVDAKKGAAAEKSSIDSNRKIAPENGSPTAPTPEATASSPN